ncbi:DUF6446 family protein [Limimaricola pyoseonensis]|uniref:Histidine kinase n=1 Tax=Limimaricola pyoseonensis TaxID=521013 RepID=A0A1G7D5S1_9RHOB|nr:DUF6446 family protein [Limimaricola pyoseonensis]SDE46306.1 hypothetical protein SAMN04488567_1781 [Limimaricola pyoseonensis]
MTARIIIVAGLVVALIAGAAMWYLQVYAFYEELDAPEIGAVTVLDDRAAPIPVAVENLRGIDSDSSPIRFRACMDIEDATPFDNAVVHERAEPLVAPGWFDCFDAAAIGAALESGEARAYVWKLNEPYGIDRVLAVTRDGRGYAWNQINACGEVVFDGDPVPPGCPTPPEGTY